MECTMMLKIENLAERAQESKLDDELKWFHINTMIGNTTELSRKKEMQKRNDVDDDDNNNAVDFESK